MVKEEKPVIFQGTGYRIIQSDTRNVALEVLTDEGGYSFKGYFGTIDQALASLVRKNLLLDETETFEISNFLSAVDQIKETIINDIKNFLKNGVSEEITADHLNEDDLYDLLG